VTHTKCYQAHRTPRARSFRADALSNTACPAVQARRREPTAIWPGVRQTLHTRCTKLKITESSGITRLILAAIIVTE
jgi:hypothetical protein